MGLRIYFCGSVSAGRQDRAIYESLIGELKRYGEVLTEAVGAKDIEVENRLPDRKLHDKYIAWLKSCDVVVAEMTQPSHGVGYEIGRALEMKKRILCLYRPSDGKRLSPMIAGAHGDEVLEVRYYQQVQEASAILKDFLGPQLRDSASS